LNDVESKSSLYATIDKRLEKEDFRMFDDIYKNKMVLITGHTGFKGSWLAIWLEELGADVVSATHLLPPVSPTILRQRGSERK